MTNNDKINYVKKHHAGYVSLEVSDCITMYDRLQCYLKEGLGYQYAALMSGLVR